MAVEPRSRMMFQNPRKKPTVKVRWNLVAENFEKIRQCIPKVIPQLSKLSHRNRAGAKRVFAKEPCLAVGTIREADIWRHAGKFEGNLLILAEPFSVENETDGIAADNYGVVCHTLHQKRIPNRADAKALWGRIIGHYPLERQAFPTESSLSELHGIVIEWRPGKSSEEGLQILSKIRDFIETSKLRIVISASLGQLAGAPQLWGEEVEWLIQDLELCGLVPTIAQQNFELRCAIDWQAPVITANRHGLWFYSNLAIPWRARFKPNPPFVVCRGKPCRIIETEVYENWVGALLPRSRRINSEKDWVTILSSAENGQPSPRHWEEAGIYDLPRWFLNHL